MKAGDRNLSSAGISATIEERQLVWFSRKNEGKNDIC